MNEASALVLALFGGVLLGTLFFGGLWWTIRRGVQSNAPAMWFLGSLLMRTSVMVGGFYVFSRGDWRQLLACLLGFWIARTAAIRLGPRPAAHAKPLMTRGEP